MRHVHLLIASLLLCLCSTTQAKNRVINQPPFCVRNTTSIEVSKIVTSDTATVLHIYAKYRPKNWIKIAAGSYLKDNNGETYQLRSGIGITPDKEFWMPESGEAEFQLVFPPVAANASSIDFTEGEGEGAFCIWGIQLKGNKLPNLILPKEAVIPTVDKNATLPEPILEYGTATLKGKFLEYNPGMPKQFYFDLSEPLKGFEESKMIDIQSDGSFNLSFPVLGTTYASIFLFGTPVQCFVESGKTTELYINLREISRQSSKYHSNDKPYGEMAYISGPLAYIAQELNSYEEKISTSIRKGYDQRMEDIASMDLATYKSYILEQESIPQKVIDQYPLSSATKQLIMLNNELRILERLGFAAHELAQAYEIKNKTSREETKVYFDKLYPKVTQEYFPQDLAKKMNTPQALLTSNYISNISMMVYRPDDLNKLLGTDKGIFFDLICAAKIYKNIKDFTPISDEQKAEISSLPASYQKALEQANEQLLLTLEANRNKDGYTINEVGDVSNEELFTSIISKFKGKVLLVDFWATWCGPCRMANKTMTPMKEDLKDKDIVYVYVTGETSPLGTWKNMIPNIHGEHFRVTDAQWAYLRENFKIEGVPTYMVIDPKGDTTFRSTGFPGVDKMKEELLKLIK